MDSAELARIYHLLWLCLVVVRVARIVVGIERYGVRVPGSRSIVRVSIAVIGRSLLTIPKLLSVDQSQTKANESNKLKGKYKINLEFRIEKIMYKHYFLICK